MTHILLNAHMFYKTMCAFFTKAFASKDSCLFLRLSIVWSHFLPPSYFSHPSLPKLMVPHQLFFDTKPPVLRQFFFAGIMTKSLRLSKKGFFLVSFHRVVKGQSHGQCLLMSWPGLLKTTLLVSCIKRKINEKIGIFR